MPEVSVSLAVGVMLATGFFQGFDIMARQMSQETRVGLFQDTVRQALYQFARDIRLAAANPTGNPDLFDHDPATDTGIDIDPDGDGDISNAILVRADKTGTTEGESDGDTEDTLESVMFHYDQPNSRVMRHSWKIPPSQAGTEVTDHTQNQGSYDAIPFLEGICTFSMKYFDRLDQPTTDAERIATVVIELTSASGPGECNNADSYTRYSYAVIRIRNR